VKETAKNAKTRSGKGKWRSVDADAEHDVILTAARSTGSEQAPRSGGISQPLPTGNRRRVALSESDESKGLPFGELATRARRARQTVYGLRSTVYAESLVAARAAGRAAEAAGSGSGAA